MGALMRSGLALTHFVTLLLATSAALLLLAWSPREFPDAAVPPGAVTLLTPRCLALAVADTTARWIPLPRVVRLNAERAGAVPTLPPPAGWYDARVSEPAGADSLRNRDGIDRPLRWRPVGTDSLDLLITGWPVGARARVAIRRYTSHGRLVGYGDSFTFVLFNGSPHLITWPPVYTVRAIRVSCSSTPAS
jgi:hypothetical protein